MLNLKQDLIRQLNTIYGVSFKEKYKNDLKDRIFLFIENIYNNKTLLELKLLKKEIVFNNLEIIKLDIVFFDKYKVELFNSFNPLWYSKEQKIILTEKEKSNSEANILYSIIQSSKLEIDNLFKKYVFSDDYFSLKKINETNLVHVYTNIVLNKRDLNKRLIIREEEINSVKKMITEDNKFIKENIDYIYKMTTTNNKSLKKWLLQENFVEEDIESLKKAILETDFNNLNNSIYNFSTNLTLLNYEITVILLKQLDIFKLKHITQ